MPPLPYVFYDQRSPDFHFDQVGSLRSKYELISLSLNGTATDPKYTAVWWRRFPPREQRFIDVAGAANVNEEILDAIADGFTPVLIAGVDIPTYFSVACTRIASGALPLEKTPLYRIGVKGFAYWNEVAHARPATGFFKVPLPPAGYVLTSVTAFMGPNGPPDYAAIWLPNAVQTFWGFEMDDKHFALQKKYNAYVAGGIRPALILPVKRRTPIDIEPFETARGKPKDPNAKPIVTFLSVWHDNAIGDWAAKWGIVSPEAFAKVRKDYLKKGLYPISVQVSGDGEDAVYAAIFGTDGGIPLRRAVTVKKLKPLLDLSGPRRVDPLEVFDRYVLDNFVVKYQARAAQLAIVRGGKLVFARAYRNAEPLPWYPDVNMTSRFRLASISKPITAVAVMQLLQDGLISFGDSVEQGLGQQSNDPNFATVSIADLLSHVSGLEQRLVASENHETIAAELNKAKGEGEPKVVLPLDTPLINEWFLHVADDVTATSPETSYQYTNENFYLLGEIIAAKRKQPYVQAVRDAVFYALGVFRADRSGNKPGDGEVFYHDREPKLARSVVHADRRLSLGQYSGNFETNCAYGGWSMAAVDMARLLAALAKGNGALLQESTKVEMWKHPFPTLQWRILRGWKYTFVGGLRGAAFHDGFFTGGVRTLAFRRLLDGLSMVLLFNTGFWRSNPGVQKGKRAELGLGSTEVVALSKLADQVKVWPSYDLFPNLF